MGIFQMFTNLFNARKLAKNLIGLQMELAFDFNLC